MDSRNTLGSLRLMRPTRRLTRREARRVVERQAAKLLRLREADDLPIPEEVISHLPRVRVYRSDTLGSLSGICHWEGGHWRITVNSRHPFVRQRFTLCHELGHILEAPFRHLADSAQVEELADYFAANVLMPKRQMQKAWADGTQDPSGLARLFGVSRAAMRWRLDELGLGHIDSPNQHYPRLSNHGERRHEYPALS